MIRTTALLLAACLMLPLAACKQAEEAAPQETVKAPLTAPAEPADREGWNAYLSDVVQRNMDGVNNTPYVYTLPPESDPTFEGAFERQKEKAFADVQNRVLPGNMLAYGGPASAKIADMMVNAFTGVQPDSMKGVKVLFIGNVADDARVRPVVTPSGATYVFVEAK